MVMRYAHHHPESLRTGIEVFDRVPGFSTVLAQSAISEAHEVGRESLVSS